MEEIKQAIRAKVIELAAQLGHSAKTLKDDAEIPATGWLDSAALMELIMWLETSYGLSIEQDELTVENFGTVNAMASYVETHAGKQAVPGR